MKKLGYYVLVATLSIANLVVSSQAQAKTTPGLEAPTYRKVGKTTWSKLVIDGQEQASSDDGYQAAFKAFFTGANITHLKLTAGEKPSKTSKFVYLSTLGDGRKEERASVTFEAYSKGTRVIYTSQAQGEKGSNFWLVPADGSSKDQAVAAGDTKMPSFLDFFGTKWNELKITFVPAGSKEEFKRDFTVTGDGIRLTGAQDCSGILGGECTAPSEKQTTAGANFTKVLTAVYGKQKADAVFPFVAQSGDVPPSDGKTSGQEGEKQMRYKHIIFKGSDGMRVEFKRQADGKIQILWSKKGSSDLKKVGTLKLWGDVDGLDAIFKTLLGKEKPQKIS